MSLMTMNLIHVYSLLNGTTKQKCTAQLKKQHFVMLENYVFFGMKKKKIYAWHKVGETIYTYDFDRDMFLRAFTYLGKSKANINDLFEVQDER